MTSLHLLAISLLAAAGALLQGSVGFGLGVFTVPFFLLIEPSLVPGPVLATSIVLTLVMAHRERHAIQIGDLKWAIGGRIVGIGAALSVLTVVPAARLSPVLGGLILVAVLITASGLHVRPRPGALLGAGALSGFMGTAVSVGGPAIALLYQRESGARVRGTLSAYFLIGTSLSLIGLHLVHRFGLRELMLAGMLLPGVLVGYLASRRVAPLFDRGYTRATVLAVSAVMGMVVILKALW